MRQLASYALESRGSTESTRTSAEVVVGQVEDWLRSKGRISDDRGSIVLQDSRVATIEWVDIRSSVGSLAGIVLTEPRPDGWFRTAISVGESEGAVAVAVGLSAASEALAPVYVDVRCPKVIRDILTSPSSWKYRGTQLSSSPVDFRGDSGGETFIGLAWDADRSVPIVAISDEYGAVLHPGIVESLASDLAGLAIVARLDPIASWRMTRRKGKEWSCYGGAIRLFWPGLSSAASPFRHPLWTPKRLLAGVSDTEAAADRIRRLLRRQILGQSAFAIAEPLFFSKIRRAAREEELAALRAKTDEDTDYKALADEFFKKVISANDEIEKRDEEIEDLKAKIRGLQYALQYRSDAEAEDVEPDTETPPSTVEEAVLVAMEGLSEELVFGDSVNDGIATLAQDAGPPDKVLSYLRILAEFTRDRRQGALGTSAVKWLQDRGAIASAESETVRNSAKERQARTWDYGNKEQRPFDLHLKPSDATAPDRCVRIYFEYDATRKKTVVGWIGRHP